jgi:WD40 repeat protein/serine/threonine protein kinase
MDLQMVNVATEIQCDSCGSSFHLELGSTTGSDLPASLHRLGRFELEGVVGAGAFGTVYKARDPRLDRTIAIKVPRGSNVPDPANLARFLREARSVAQLRHPAIVAVHEVGEADGVPYLVSDFIAGITLADHLSARLPTTSEAASLAAAVADALDHAHSQGVVHRDVKPTNIMLNKEGDVFVMDFGLAKHDSGETIMTQDGQVLGTPAFMSPEQARGEAHQVDGRTDVYSLGVILYRMLTGELPFRGSSRMLLHQVLNEDPRPPRSLNDRIPKDLETICLKAMAKEPARRYATARELADDLRRFQKGEPIRARPVSAFERLRRWCQRNPAVAAWSSATLLSLVAGVVTAAVLAWRASERAAEADRQNERANQATAEAVRAFESESEQRNLYQQAAENERRERRKAERNLSLSRLNLYSSEMIRAEQAQRDSQPGIVKELLAECPAEFREWEWHHLRLAFFGTTTILHTLGGDAEQALFHPDGVHVVTWGAGGLVVRNIQTGEPTPALEGRDSSDLWKFQFVISPDGKRLVAAGEVPPRPNQERQVVIQTWDCQTWKLARTATANHALAHWQSMLLSPAADYLAVVTDSPAGQSLRLLDVDTGSELASIKPGEGGVRKLAISATGRHIATAKSAPQGTNGFVVQVWDRKTGMEVGKLKELIPLGFPELALALSADGKRLATGVNQINSGSTVKCWDSSTGELLYTAQGKTGMITGGLAFSPDGAFLACGDPIKLGKISGEIKVWDAGSGAAIMTLHGHSGQVNSVAWSSDSRFLVSTAMDSTIRVWAGRHEPHCQPFSGNLAAWSADGQRLATAVNKLEPGGKRHSSLALWNVGTGATIQVSPPGQVETVAVGLSADGKYLLSVEQERVPGKAKQRIAVRRWSTVTGEQAGSFVLPGRCWMEWTSFRENVLGPIGTMPVAFSPDGRRLAAVTHAEENDGKALAAQEVAVFETETGKQVFARPIQFGRVFRVAWSPDGRRLAFAAGERVGMNVMVTKKDPGKDPAPPPGQVKVLDAETGAELHSYQGHPVGINAVLFSPGGTELVTADGQGLIKVWDAASARELRSFQDPSKLVFELALTPNGRRLAAAGGDHTVKLFDYEEGRLVFALRGFDSDVLGLGFDHEGQRLLTVSVKGVGKLWESEIPEDVVNGFAAAPLVASLFKEWGLQSKVLQELSTAPKLSEGVRRKALNLASKRMERGVELDPVGWRLARQPGQQRSEYQLALEIATKLDKLGTPPPGDFHAGGATIRGAAQYRLGQYTQALATLTARPVADPSRARGYLPVLAMTQWQLKRTEEARGTLSRLKTMNLLPFWSMIDPADKALIAEAQTLISNSEDGR